MLSRIFITISKLFPSQNAALQTMAKGEPDESTCIHHGVAYHVILYCHTCHELLCPRCLTHGTNGFISHKDHAFLDISDAYEIFKEELEKAVSKFQDYLKSAKTVKVELQTRVQKLKFEILRRNTMLDRQMRRFQDTINGKKREVNAYIRKLIQPAVDRNERNFKVVDDDVASIESLLASAESLQFLPGHRKVAFLKAFHPTKQAMEGVLLDVDSKPDYEDKLDELRLLHKLDLTFRKELNSLQQSFLMPDKDLQRPRILIDWCTIGSTSASIYWRCNSNRNNVTSFRLCYKLVANDHLNVAFPQLSEAPSSAALVKSGFQFVRLNKFLSKRSSAVLRNLAPQSLYVLALFSANNISESPPSISCFQTSGDQGLGRQGWISHVLPKHRLFTRIYQMVSKVLHRLLYFVLFIYFLLSLFVVVYHSQDLYDAVRHNLFYLFLSDLSTGICSTPPPVDLRSKDQISSEEPWFSWF